MNILKKTFRKKRNIEKMSQTEENSSQQEECLCGERYCKPCNSVHWRDNFQNWTSGDINIDQLIQEAQLNARWSDELLEWIEYSNLKNIKHLAEGGFASVYKAIW